MLNAGAAVKMNKDGSLGFYSTFPVINYFAIEQAVEVPDGYFLAGTYQQDDLSVDVILLKVDKQGKELWRKYYNDSGRMMSFNDLCFNNDNKIILTAGSGDGTTNLNSTVYSCHWVLDSLGNVTKTWRNNIHNVENGMRNLQILPNGNWLYSTGAFVAFGSSNWALLPKLVCRDSNMNLLWQRFIPSYLSFYHNINNIQPSGDGNWLVVGGIIPPEPNIKINGFIRKFSSGGDSIWQRMDLAIPNPVFESENRMGGIVTLPGGNLVAAGFTTFYSDTLIKSWGWLMKISSNGCLFETDCMPASGTSLTGGEPLGLSVSPNPANDLVSFEMPGQSGHLRVFDLQGRLIFYTPFEGQTNWNSRNAAAGVYGYLLQLEDGRTVSGKILVEH